MSAHPFLRHYPADPEPAANPVMGYAPRIGDKGDARASLRYLDLTWRELEPEKGRLCWEEIAQRLNLAALREQGIHLVLRFLCDRPGLEEHLDIPDWLYQATMDGTFYRTAYGCGYCPDYTNTVFCTEHARVLQALGEACSRDGMVAFVELGSLGHWGEWHVLQNAGLPPFPDEALRAQYVLPYKSAFPQAKLLMRRPFRDAAEGGMGLYNDMAGEPQATEEWLDWIEHGGWYGMEPNAMQPMPEFWRTAPAGGELTSALSMRELMDTQLEQTVELVKRSHMTFLGPLAPDPDFAAGYRVVLGCLGYRLRVTCATLEPLSAGGCLLTVTLCNEGSTPFYWDWPVCVQLEDWAGREQECQTLPLPLTALQPGTEQTAQMRLRSGSIKFLWMHRMRVTLGIRDPMTGRLAVRFAMQAPQKDGKVLLFGI